MVLTNTEYNENHYNGRNTGIKLAWGYGNLKERGQLNQFDEGDESNPYNGRFKELLDLIPDDFTDIKLLDVGGAIGNFSHIGKSRGVTTWDILDHNIDSWCENNKLPTVDSFITGDATVLLADKQQFKKNDYDVIFSSQFLECIDDVDLPDLITEMNRIAKTVQIHLITTTISDSTSATKYNLKTLADWATLGFDSGTRLLDFISLEMLVV